MKITNTTVRVSIDGKKWSGYMTVNDFIKYSKGREFDSVEVSEVLTKEEAIQLIQKSN